ncbi:MAG: RNA-binding cell elongation regulator Jag/EloR [Dehalococcoidia bacterium]
MTEMDAVETSGKTIEEAIARALQQLGLDRDQVEIEVLSEGRGGILGIGAEPARVLVSPVFDDEDDDEDDGPDEAEADGREDIAEGTATAAVADEERDGDRPVLSVAEATDLAVETLQTLLDLMGLDTTVQARPPSTPGDGVGLVTAILDVTGEELGLLIGRRGDTLATLQYMLNLLVRRQVHNRVMFGIDVEGYRRRREDSLTGLAQRMADRVRSSGQSITLEPMPPAERRLVHMTLADDPDVLTVSIGEGEARKVAITPRR